MKFKVRYTVEEVKEECTEMWGCLTKEESISAIKKYVEDDPSYIFEGFDKFTIKVELVED